MLFIAFYIAAQMSISDVHINLKKITYKPYSIVIVCLLSYIIYICNEKGSGELRSKCSFIHKTQEEVRQAKFSNENRCNKGKAESSTGAIQWSGQAADGEDIKRQAANGQKQVNSPDNQRQI